MLAILVFLFHTITPIGREEKIMINDDIKGSASIRDGRITTSDVQDKAITTEKLADEVTASMLPEVDDEDAGKTVVVSEEGKWEVGETGGGGGGALLIDFDDSYFDDGFEIYTSTADVSMDDLVTAFKAGQNVMVTVSAVAEGKCARVCFVWETDGSARAYIPAEWFGLNASNESGYYIKIQANVSDASHVEMFVHLGIN